MKKAIGGRLDAVYPVAEFGDVEIDLQNALLRPHGFDEHSEIGLERFAQETTVPEEQVLGHLLGNRARAAQLLAMLAGAHRLANGFEVKAVMKGKLLVF